MVKNATHPTSSPERGGVGLKGETLLHVWTLNAHQPTDCKYCSQQVYKVETFLRPSTARKVGQIRQ